MGKNSKKQGATGIFRSTVPYHVPLAAAAVLEGGKGRRWESREVKRKII
jgi:hypothetical protein